jgi:hypothetical protein
LGSLYQLHSISKHLSSDAFLAPAAPVFTPAAPVRFIRQTSPDIQLQNNNFHYQGDELNMHYITTTTIRN